MDQKVQGNFQPNIQKPSDEQYFKYKILVEIELGLDWSKEKKYLLHGRLNARLFELGINYDQYYDLLINDQETGMAVLRLIEIIGQDKVKDLGSETLYFLINALNQMNIDPIRNEILYSVLPLRA